MNIVIWFKDTHNYIPVLVGSYKKNLKNMAMKTATDWYHGAHGHAVDDDSDQDDVVATANFSHLYVDHCHMAGKLMP